MTQDETCRFCHIVTERPNDEVIAGESQHWLYVLQPEKKRLLTKKASGLLISKRHVATPYELNSEEFAELKDCLVEASELFCKAVGETYLGQESVGFNAGTLAGQTIPHAHIHVLPVTEADPAELKSRGGIGGAFEALRRERLGD